MRIPLSIEDQKEVREAIANKINSIMEDLSAEEMRETRDQFIEKFILCEIAYKIVLKKALIINDEFTTDNRMTLRIPQIISVLKLAGYEIEDDMLRKLFQTTEQYGLRGSKSAKLLRNGLEHGMNINDIKEIIERKEELFSLMEDFLEIIQR